MLCKSIRCAKVRFFAEPEPCTIVFTTFSTIMLIFKRKADIVGHLQNVVEKGKSIGFVPTMGALHNGHISLVNQCKAATDLVVCSIFVNPTQFNDPSDFEKYPITIEQDIYQLEKNGCDVLFLPTVEEIYPGGWQKENLQQYDLGFLETVFEGQYRAGHFQGVCQVMHRLLDIVSPHYLFMGQKDYQQCMVVNRLLQLIDSPAKLVVCTTLREADGLAMSSRNMRLDAEERTLATGIYKAMKHIKQNLKPGAVATVVEEGLQIMKEQQLKADYLEVAQADDLTPVNNWNGQTNIVILAAAFMGKVRLIDNLVLPPNFAGHGN